MIIWVFILIDVIIGIIYGITCGLDLLASIGAATLLYAALVIISMAVTLLASMLLGKRDKFVLRKISKYEITHLDTQKLQIANGETLNLSCIDNTIYVDDDITPTLEIRQYNIGGWRYRWLLAVYPDRYEYIVYLPKNKTED